MILTVFMLVILAFIPIAFFRLKSAFFVFLFLYSIYPRFFAIGLSSEGFAFTMQRAMILVLFFVFILRWLYGSTDIRNGIDRLRDNKFIYVSLILILVSKLCGNVVMNRFDGGDIAALATTFLFTFFVALLTVVCLENRRDIYLAILLIVVSLQVNLFIVVIEYINQASIFEKALEIDYTVNTERDLLEGATRDGSYRVMGLFDNPLELVTFVLMTLPLAIVLFVRSTDSVVKTIAAMVILLSVPGLVWTNSRTAVICALVLLGIGLYYLIAIRLSKNAQRLFLVSGLVVLSALLYTYRTELISIFLLGTGAETSSTLGRLRQYILSGPTIMQSPIFGFGYARNIADVVRIKPLDSYWLRTMHEGGFVALGLLVAIFFYSWNVLRKIALQSNDRNLVTLCWGLLATIIVTAVMAFVQTVSHPAVYLYVVFGLVMLVNSEHKRYIALGTYPGNHRP